MCSANQRMTPEIKCEEPTPKSALKKGIHTAVHSYIRKRWRRQRNRKSPLVWLSLQLPPPSRSHAFYVIRSPCYLSARNSDITITFLELFVRANKFLPCFTYRSRDFSRKLHPRAARVYFVSNRNTRLVVGRTKSSATLLFYTLALLKRQVQQWSTGRGITLNSLFLQLHCSHCYETGMVTVQTWAPELLYLASAAPFETKPHCVTLHMMLLWQISSITSAQQSVHILCYRGISYWLVMVHNTCTHNTAPLHFMCGRRS